MPNTLVRRPWCFHCFCFFYFQMWWELLLVRFFPNVNGIVSSSDISFLFMVPLVHSKWDFEGGAHSQTSLWTLERGFSWLIAKISKTPLDLFVCYSRLMSRSDLGCIFARAGKKRQKCRQFAWKLPSHSRLRPLSPNPASGQPNAIDSEPSCLLVAPLVLFFFKCSLFSNSCASASINI